MSFYECTIRVDDKEEFKSLLKLLTDREWTDNEISVFKITRTESDLKKFYRFCERKFFEFLDLINNE